MNYENERLNLWLEKRGLRHPKGPPRFQVKGRKKAPQVIYDSAAPENWVCPGCGEPIKVWQDQIVYGVGGVNYLKIYHAACPPPHPWPPTP